MPPRALAVASLSAPRPPSNKLTTGLVVRILTRGPGTPRLFPCGCPLPALPYYTRSGIGKQLARPLHVLADLVCQGLGVRKGALGSDPPNEVQAHLLADQIPLED